MRLSPFAAYWYTAPMTSNTHNGAHVARLAQQAFERGKRREGCDYLATLFYFLNNGTNIAIGNQFDLARILVSSSAPPHLTRFQTNAEQIAVSARTACREGRIDEAFALLSSVAGMLLSGVDTIIENEFRLEQGRQAAHAAAGRR